MLTNNFVGQLNYVILCLRWCACTCYSNENSHGIRAMFKACASHEIIFFLTYRPWVTFYRRSDVTWWCHQMETFSAFLAFCGGNSPHEGQWRGALMFSLIGVWINGWINNRDAGDSRCHRAHYDVIVVMVWYSRPTSHQTQVSCTPTIPSTNMDVTSKLRHRYLLLPSVFSYVSIKYVPG